MIKIKLLQFTNQVDIFQNTRQQISRDRKRGHRGTRWWPGTFFVGKDGRVGWGEVTFCHLLNAEIPLGG